MTYFRMALSAPQLHFRQLKQIEPCYCNGSIDIKQTSRTIEAFVMLNERRYLLSIPIGNDIIPNIERIEDELRNRRQGPLINTRIFYDELTLTDSAGYRHKYSILLQEIPNGKILTEAVYYYSAATLHSAIRTMKSRLDAIGFLHNNLHAGNIVICNDGIARPLRYHYAQWLDYTNNTTDALHKFIDESTTSTLSDTEVDYVGNTTNGSTLSEHKHNGLVRKFKCGLYGFEDGEGNRVTKFEFTWAGEFQEGRAIVAKNHKMGAIDCNGKRVISIRYSSLEFDVVTGNFIGCCNGYRYIINYDGTILHRTKMNALIEDEKQEVAI